jgi:hypothetical protein
MQDLLNCREKYLTKTQAIKRSIKQVSFFKQILLLNQAQNQPHQSDSPEFSSFTSILCLG